jgi:hypothetical protein
MRWLLCLMAVWFLAGKVAFGQDCPKWDKAGPDIPSKSRSLNGLLLFHNDLRQWFELKLDKVQCGQKSIQLIRISKSINALAVLRGCRVHAYGTLGDAGTTYYSLDMYQDVTRIAPDHPCIRKPLFPNYSKVQPDKSVQSYRVQMNLNYGADGPLLFHVSDGKRTLRPWQAYAKYDVSGSFMIEAHCSGGFVVDQVSGTPEAEPRHFDEPRTPDDSALFDPESAAGAKVYNLKMDYTCIRNKN